MDPGEVFGIIFAFLSVGFIYIMIGYVLCYLITDSIYDKDLMISYIVIWPIVVLVHIVKAIFRSFKRW